MRNLGHILEDILGWITLGLIVMVFALFFVWSWATIEAQRRFMTECKQYRKHYECVAMWRAGNADGNVVVVPMAIRH